MVISNENAILPQKDSMPASGKSREIGETARFNFA